MFGFLDKGKDKGKIEIEISKTSFSQGESIDGKAILELTKPQKGKKLIAEIFGVQVRGKKSGSIYYKAQILDGEKEYPANQRLVYHFQLNFPYTGDIYAFLAGTINVPAAMESMYHQMLTSAPIDWQVRVKLEVSGFNVENSVKITIS
jgi:hypothetical protein